MTCMPNSVNLDLPATDQYSSINDRLYLHLKTKHVCHEQPCKTSSVFSLLCINMYGNNILHLSVECYSYWTKLACRLLNYLNFVQHSTQFSGQFSYWCRVNCYTAHARGVHIDIDYYWMDGVWLRPYARTYGSSRAGVSLGSSEWTSCPLGCMEGNTWRRLYLNSSSRSISSSLIPPPSWPAYLE